MAIASGGRRPQNLYFLVDESEEDEEVDFSELPCPYSGDKRPSSSKQQPKKLKKKGNMPSIDETFMNMCSMMTGRFGQQSQQVDGPENDPYDILACLDVLDTIGLDIKTKFWAFKLLHKQDKEMRKTFFFWNPEFRQYWLTNMFGGE